jgi:hypothetical protein
MDLMAETSTPGTAAAPAGGTPRTAAKAGAKRKAPAKRKAAPKRKASAKRKASPKARAAGAAKAKTSATKAASRGGKAATRRKAGTRRKAAATKKGTARTKKAVRASAASAKARTSGVRRRKASRAKARTSSTQSTSRGGLGAGMSRDMLRSVEEGQRAALDAVRRFVDTVERALPLRDGGNRRQQEIVDSALEMADRLVQTQYDLLRKAMRSLADLR